MNSERFDEPFWRWLGSAWARSAPFVRIVAIFVLLGLVVFNFGFRVPTLIVVLGMPLVFVVGAAPALATGLVVAVWHARSGRAGVMAAVISGVACTGAARGLVRMRATAGDVGWDFTAFVMLLGGVASLACWWIVIGPRRSSQREALP